MNNVRNAVALSLLIACAPANRLAAVSAECIQYAHLGIEFASFVTLAWGMTNICSYLSDIRDLQQASLEGMEALMNECPTAASFTCAQAVAEHVIQQTDSLQSDRITYTQTFVASKNTDNDGMDDVDFIEEDDEDDDEFEDEELEEDELETEVAEVE